MKKTGWFIFLLLSFISCNKKAKIEKEVESISVDIKVNRFDKAFFETNPKDLKILKVQYPFFFPPGVSDSVWIGK